MTQQRNPKKHRLGTLEAPKKQRSARAQERVKEFVIEAERLLATKDVKSKKRIGRPTKKPKPGERVPLGLRVTPKMKERLEAAATKKGRSLSQEAEFRLEMSLASDRQLILAYGGAWLSVHRFGDDLNVALPISWEEETGCLEEDLVTLKITKHDLDRIRNYFTGARPPYDMTRAEEDAWAEEMRAEIFGQHTNTQRGK